MFPRNAAPLTRMLSYQPFHIRTLQRGMRRCHPELCVKIFKTSKQRAEAEQRT